MPPQALKAGLEAPADAAAAAWALATLAAKPDAGTVKALADKAKVTERHTPVPCHTHTHAPRTPPRRWGRRCCRPLRVN
jgi:hypothetical protein